MPVAECLQLHMPECLLLNTEVTFFYVQKAEVYNNTSLRMQNKDLLMSEVETEIHKQQSGMVTNGCEPK
jgi:hypothetical protein